MQVGVLCFFDQEYLTSVRWQEHKTKYQSACGKSLHLDRGNVEAYEKHLVKLEKGKSSYRRASGKESRCKLVEHDERQEKVLK